MQMKKLKVLICFALLSLLLCSCGAKITVDEVKAALPELVEASQSLNEIYFGEGFGIDENNSDVKANGGYFYCDTFEKGLNSIIEIKEATEKVFTPEYATILYQAAFEGTSSGISVEAARYIEGEMGLMQKADADVYELPNRIFDYNTLQIVKGGSDRVTVKIHTVAEGKNEDIEMIVVRYGTEESGYYYRIDSPTY